MSVPFSTKISRRSAVSDGSAEQVNLTSTSATSDPVQTFNRFKTTYQQILSTDEVSQSQPDPNQNQPISCQALLASGANAVIASSDADGKHTLPPSGSSINAHLNTLLYAPKVKLGQGAASTSQGTDAVAIGLNAGQNQSDLSIAIGKDSGQLNQQYSCIAIGTQAGQTQQGGLSSYSIAIGDSAGQTNQDFSAIAMGHRAGSNNQSYETIAIGSASGYNNQGSYAIAIGSGAGQQSQGSYAISIGHFPPGPGNTVSTAGQFQQSANSIVLNASGNDLHGNLGTGRFYVDPIRNATSSNVLHYDPTTKEITYDTFTTSSSSSSLTIDTEANATSTATREAQVVGTGIFYQNGTQLRVQYKSSSSNYQDVLIGSFDTTSPVITILGDNPAIVIQGATYTDAGATALDNVDGDVSSSITSVITDSNGAVVSSVDTTTSGVSYSVTYSVSDSTGNTASAIRTVQVSSPVNYPLLADLASLASGLQSSDSVTVNGTTYTFTKSSTFTSPNFVGTVDRSPTWVPNLETGNGFNLDDNFTDANGNVVSGPYFGMQLSSQIIATSVKLYVYYQILNRTAANFSLYGSNDGSAWYLIGTTGQLPSTDSYSYVGQTEWTDVFTGTYNSTQMLYYELSLTNSTAYSYYRVSAHSCFGQWWSVNEFRLMGV
jgi:hypothetical protein